MDLPKRPLHTEDLRPVLLVEFSDLLGCVLWPLACARLVFGCVLWQR